MHKETENKNGSVAEKRIFPYDWEDFIQWCVNKQGKSVSTAKSYLSSLRTAFTSEFDLEMENPFESLSNAFRRLRQRDEEAFRGLEYEYQSLRGYKELMEKYSDFIITDSGEILPAPVDMWLTATKTYLKYIRWRIDRYRQIFGMELNISDDKDLFLDLPFSKEFRHYLKTKGKGYTSKSIDSYFCKLRRLYNLFFRRILKRDVMPDLETYIKQGHSLTPFLEKLESRIDFAKEGHIAPELTEDDFARGKTAFIQYKEFIEDFSSNPDKYPTERYYPA